MPRKNYENLNDLIGDLDRDSILSEEDETLDDEDIEILHEHIPPPPPQKPPRKPPVRKPPEKKFKYRK